MSSIEMQSISIKLFSCMNATLNLDVGCEYSALMLTSLTLFNVKRNVGQNFTYSKCKCSFFSCMCIENQDDKAEIEFCDHLKKSLKVYFNVHMYRSFSYILYHPKIVYGKWKTIKFIEKPNGQYYFDYNIQIIVEKCPYLKFCLHSMVSFSAYDGTLS